MNDVELRATISRVMRGLNHDLKNPLGAADGYLDLLLQGFRGDLTEEQKQTLERVRALIGSGVGILEDVVAYTRATIGELKVRPSETDVRAIVRMTLERHATRARNAGIELKVDAPAEPLRITTDADLVGQIVDRLLANALDHAPDGSRVDIALASNGGGVTVRVSDTGNGVPDADRERVFLPFERGPQPVRPRETTGIGFGLALGRSLAERLGGKLELEAGTGSTFVLELPAESR